MARVRLTKNVIAGLDKDRDGDWVTDTEVPQLLVRLTPTAKTYVARWTSKVTGKRLTTSIAPCGSISVDEARDRARKLVTADAAPTVTTLADVYKIWLEQHADDGTAHVADFKSAWKNHIEPHFGKTKLPRLTNAEIQRWYDAKRKEYPVVGKSGRKRDTPYAAVVVNRWVAYISKLCTIARKGGFMVGNPCEDVEKSTPNRRVTVFVTDDVKALSDNLDAVAERYPIAVGLIRFLMIYPCRGIEARGMRWSDLDLNAGTFTIPAERYKTRESKVFPLGPLQIAHLHSLPRWSDTFVFPAPKNRDAAMRYEYQRDTWKKVRPKPLGAHTLRKTIGTAMMNKGIPLEIVSKLLGHSSTLVTHQVYAHLSADTVAKQLALWSGLTQDDKEEPTPSERADMDVLKFQAAKVMAEEFKV